MASIPSTDPQDPQSPDTNVQHGTDPERRETRLRLLAARESLDAPTLERWRLSIDSLIERAFPALSGTALGFCWPIRNEYDARPLVSRFMSSNSSDARRLVACLPVVEARGAPMRFRAWHPGDEMTTDAHGIPVPVRTEAVTPKAILLPLVGWDEAGYRLGYGGGYMDRTLAAISPRPLAIGVGYEQGRLATIHPGAWDIPMDWIVTERAVYRREDAKLTLEITTEITTRLPAA